MWKTTIFICLLTSRTLVYSEANCNEKCSDVKSQNTENKTPQINIYTGDSTYVIAQDLNNNYIFIPKSNPNTNVPQSEQLSNEQNSNGHNTIFIVRPSKKNKTCDHNSSKTEKTTVPTPMTITDVPTSPPHTSSVTTVYTPTTKLSTPITKTTVELSSTPYTHTTVKPSTPEIIPPTMKTTKQPSTRNYSTIQPDVKTKYPPIINTTKKPTSTLPPHTKEPNTLSTPTKITPTPNPRDPTGYDMYCLYDGMYRANNVTCDQYYVCINGIRYLMDCPYGLVFNDDIKVCDWLENVKDCHPPAFEEFLCPDEDYGIDDQFVLKFRYRDSCSQYIACHKKKPRLLTCEEGNSFDEDSGDCNNLKNVSNCRNVEYSY